MMIKRNYNKLKNIIVFALRQFRGKSLKLPGDNWYYNSIIDTLIPQFIHIGRNFVSSPNSIILAHDASYYLFCGKYQVEPTIIGDDVFLGAGAIILPVVTVGNKVVIGAGSVVT